MKNQAMGPLGRFIFTMFMVSAMFVLPSFSQAQQDDADESTRKSFFDRPDILNLARLGLSAEEIKDLSTENMNLQTDADRRAHLVFAAQMLELYPQHEIYFVGHESARMYDAARLVTSGTHEGKRIHLLFVSRKSLDSGNLDFYLNENGISEKSLQGGKKILLVHAATSSLLSKLVMERYSKAAQKNIQTHYVKSRNPNELGSNAFLSMVLSNWEKSGDFALRYSYDDKYPVSKVGPKVEHYEVIGNKWHPVALLSNSMLGNFENKHLFDLDLGDMILLNAQWQRQGLKDFFYETRTLIRLLRNFLSEGATENIQELTSQPGRPGRLARALARDVIQFMAKTSEPSKVSAADLGFRKIQSKYDLELEQVKRDYPEWRSFVEDPVLESYRIVHARDTAKLMEFQKIPFPFNIQTIMRDEIFQEKSQRLEQFQLDFIHQISKDDLWKFANAPRELMQKGMKRQALAVIDRFHGEEFGRIMLDTFKGYQERQNYPDIILHAIIKADDVAMNKLRTGLARKGRLGFSIATSTGEVEPIFNAAMGIADRKNRINFLRTELAKIGSPLAAELPDPTLSFDLLNRSRLGASVKCESVFIANP